MDLRKIKKLIEMLQESDLNEIEVKEGEESVRINRKMFLTLKHVGWGEWWLEAASTSFASTLLVLLNSHADQHGAPSIRAGEVVVWYIHLVLVPASVADGGS